jgi:hypothetical protein
MFAKLGYFKEILEEMPMDKSFLRSELPISVHYMTLRQMCNRELLRKAGKGGECDRLWKWEVTDKAKKMLERERKKLGQSNPFSDSYNSIPPTI